MKNKVIALLLLCIALGCKQHGATTYTWDYPKVKPDTVVDVYFGKKIVDPYRNIEDIADTAIQDWFLSQRTFFDSIIHHISGRDTLHKEICRLAYSSDIRGSLPRPAGDKLFFKRKYIKEKMEKLFMSDSLTENMAELFSTGSLNRRDSAYYSIDYYEPSYNGKYIAFALSSDGDESNVIHVLDVEKKVLLPERIEQAVSGNPQWLPDGSGFFYKQLRIPPEGNPADFKRLEQSRIRLHILNTDPEKDREIFSKKASPHIPIDNIDFPRFFIFPGSPYVLATLNNGSSNYSELYTCKLDEVLANPSSKIRWQNIATREDEITDYTIKNNKLFAFSYKSNPNGKLVVLDLENKDKQRVIFDRNTMVLSSIIQTKKAIYFTASVNGRDSLFKVNFPDQRNTSVNIPLSGTFDLRPSFGIVPYYSNCNYLLFALNSWDKEWGVYYFNEGTGTLKKLKSRPACPYGMPPGLTVKEVEVLAHDGEKIPLTIIHKNNVKLNGKNPTLLHAYGAYGYSIEPYFNVTKLAWYNRGGIYAEAHVRGGSEKGDNWYKGGRKATKPNSWKDFISCAEYLVNNGYTNPGQLAAEGASAGGITIGRAITERPGLFKAAVVQVGFLNTMRHEFSSNNTSASEFGTVYDSVEIRYLYEMDTYHHIQEGVKYPALLFTTGMNDPRVAPWDPGKVVAKMQALKDSPAPVLFRVSGEGHLGDADSETQTSDIYTFLFWQLGLPNSILK